MWVGLALLAAITFAAHSLTLKESARDVDVVRTTMVVRLGSGLLLLAVALAIGDWPPFTPAYFRALAIVVPPEVAGMVFLGLALRHGELSVVQPILGLVPVFVTLGGMVVLHEVPSPTAAAGIALVAAGVYCVGLERGRSWREPIRALGRSRASWYAITTAVFFSITTLTHKFGIAEVGALPWGVSVAIASGVLLALLLPLLGRSPLPLRTPGTRWRPAALVSATIALFALHMFAIQSALGIAPAGYVIALASTSTLMATLLGIAVLRERTGSANRVAGAVLVTCGAVLIAALG